MAPCDARGLALAVNQRRAPRSLDGHFDGIRRPYSASGYPRCVRRENHPRYHEHESKPGNIGPAVHGGSLPTVVCADVEIIQCLGPTDLNKEQLSNKRASRDELSPNILDEDVLLSDVDQSHIASAHSPVSEQELRKYLVAFGGESTSYFHLQDGVDYFHLRGIGFMSYREERTLLHRMRFVFAKPVCADHHLDLLLDKFMAWNDVETVFLSADAAFAKRLSVQGYRVNDMGSDFIIPLDTFKVSGRKIVISKPRETS